MTAVVFTGAVQGAAVTHGLCGLLVLNGEMCEDPRHPSDWRSCRSCLGSGFVAPSVTPGQHLAIATTRTEPDYTKAEPITVRRTDTTPPIVWSAEKGWINLHLGSVIGSVTATTPALPIVDEHPGLHPEQDTLYLSDIGDGHPYLHLIHADGRVTDLSGWLPWLGDELVGRWAVLIDNPTRTTEHCPANGCDLGHPRVVAGHCVSIDGEWWHEPGSCACGFDCCDPVCATCGGRGSCPPVPLPDDVDLTEGTIVEVDL